LKNSKWANDLFKEKKVLNIKELQHIGIIVNDAKASADWYMKLAKFSKMGSFDIDGSKIIFVRNNESGVMLELIQRPENSEQANAVKDNKGYIDHIAFGTDDVKREAKEAKKMGLDVIEGPVFLPTLWDNGLEYVLIKSVTGEKIEFCKKL